MNYVHPTISDPEWRWPFRKFSLKHKDLFTTLNDRFNTQTIPLQNPTAFHSDVCELVCESETLEEFYSALEKRKEQRIQELNRAWDDVAVTIACRPALIGCRVCFEDDLEDTGRPPGSINDTRAERWWSFVQYARMPSFDNIVTFFDGYVRNERKNRSAKWTGKRRRPVIEDNPSTATHGTTEATEEHNKPEPSCKASPEAPKPSGAPSDPQPTSSTVRRHEAQEGLMQAFKMIDELCDFTNVGENVSNDAKNIFRLTDKYKMMNGNSQNAVLYGCIFLACRKHNVPRTFSEIFYCLNANKTEVKKVVKQFQDFLHKFPLTEGEGATQKTVQTTEGSAARKKTNEGDAQGSQRKRRRVMSESAGDSDAERLAASEDKSKAAEAMPTSKRAEKRKRPDDLQDEAREKRPRTDCSPVPGHSQLAADSPNTGRFDGYGSSTDSSTDGLSTITLLHDNILDMASKQWSRKNTEMPAPSPSSLAYSASGQSPLNQDLGTVDASQALPRGDAEQLPSKDTPADMMDSKRSQSKPQANRRQQVDKRRLRREQETLSPQKQPPRKTRQEWRASPSIDHVVRSRRSSRRGTRQKLLFLGEDGTPCVAANKRKI